MIERDEAIRLLKGGPEGVEEWDRRRTAVEGLLDLSGIDLSGIDLSDYNLAQVDLSWADLSRANLAGARLSRANLTEAELIGTNLVKANLSEATLTKANLFEATVLEAMMSATDLSDADLTAANLAGVVLSEANLTNTHLFGSNLTGAFLLRADLTGALSWNTTWGDVDLSTVKGLDTIRHNGPSTIGIDTIIKSRGKIPPVFLKGCGVPDSFIDYIPSLIDSLSPIQFYSCFISYSHKNEDFAQRLYGRLQQAGLRVWYAPEDMRGGRKSHDQIDEAIRFHDKLLLVLSDESMASEWVATEIRKARKREKTEGRQVLFPIRLVSIGAIREWDCFDADTGKDMAVEIREYHIPDFSNWKDHDAFEAGFARLLDDLKAGAE